MKYSDYISFDAKIFTQTLPEFKDKLRVLISDERVRQITNSLNVINKDSYDRENIEISERNKAFKFVSRLTITIIWR